MPIIPRGQENVRANPSNPVPIASTGWARTQGEAIANLGEGVNEIGQRLLESDQRISRDEGTDSIRNTAVEAKLYADKNSKPDGSDYQAKMIEYAEPRMAEARNKYGTTPRVRAEIDSFTKRVQGDMNTTGMIQSAQMLEKSNIDRIDQLQQSSAQRLYTNPKMLDAELQSQNQLIDDQVKIGVISPANAIKMKQAYRDRSAEQIISGLDSRQQYGAAINLLGATQSSEGLVSSLDPDEAVKLLSLIHI